MTNFDEFLKNKARSEKIDVPSNVDLKIERVLNNIPLKKKKKKPVRTLLIAAIITTLTTLGAVAGPKVVEFTGNAIDYFNLSPQESRHLADKAIMQKFSMDVGVKATDQGISLTIDSIAIDDNFINVFYTIESETAIDKNQITGEGGFQHQSVSGAPHLRFKVDGKDINPGHIIDREVYLESDYVLKGMERSNISQNNFSENFILEIYTHEIFNTKGDWNIPLHLDVSLIREKSLIATPNIKATVVTGSNKDSHRHNITIEKVIISPFGNQIVINERARNNRIFNTFAIKDDKGEFLNVYETGYGMRGGLAKSTNSFEFMNARADLEYIIIVPLNTGNLVENHRQTERITAELSQSNIKLKVSEFGVINIQSVELKNNMIKIQYTMEGLVPHRGSFILLDENDEMVGLGDVFVEERVDRHRGIYTTIFNAKNATPEQIDKITKIGTFTQNVELLYEQQIKVPLR